MPRRQRHARKQRSAEQKFIDWLSATAPDNPTTNALGDGNFNFFAIAPGEDVRPTGAWYEQIFIRDKDDTTMATAMTGDYRVRLVAGALRIEKACGTEFYTDETGLKCGRTVYEAPQ